MNIDDNSPPANKRARLSKNSELEQLRAMLAAKNAELAKLQAEKEQNNRQLDKKVVRLAKELYSHVDNPIVFAKEVSQLAKGLHQVCVLAKKVATASSAMQSTAQAEGARFREMCVSMCGLHKAMVEKWGAICADLAWPMALPVEYCVPAQAAAEAAAGPPQAAAEAAAGPPQAAAAAEAEAAAGPVQAGAA
jgi:hypothetical protein